MSKSLDVYLLSAIQSILTDILSHYPGLAKGIKRDNDRLALLVRTRGIRSLTVDLADLGKHFDKCLAQGQYTSSGLANSSRVNKKTVIPKLFSGLLLLVFEQSGVLKAQPDIAAIRYLRQLYLMAKKLKLQCKGSDTARAVAEYVEIEDSLPPPDLTWGQTTISPSSQLSLENYDAKPDGLFGKSPSGGPMSVCQTVFDILSVLLGPYEPKEWRFKHGPGAVSDLSLGSRSKYDFPSWSDRLERVYPIADFGYANYQCWADAAHANNVPSGDDISSELIAVPKTQKGPRLIAKEPTANQWCQQNLAAFFARRFADTIIGRSVALRDQTVNQSAARSASVTGDYWTVDLSSASDRVTCRLIERVFRANSTVLHALNASRTHYLSQKIDKKSPKLIKLKKFSSMGNACTFPVESFVFYGISVASMLLAYQLQATTKTIEWAGESVHVFGDDIVIPKIAGEWLLHLLQALSFKVNTDKTFKVGNFRESCGVDAFRGHDVTPVYIRKMPERRRPESVISAVDTVNNFYRRGYWRTSAYLRGRVPVREIRTVAMDSGAFGYESIFGAQARKLDWSTDLQRPTVFGLSLRAKSERSVSEGQDNYLQFFTEATDGRREAWTAGYSCRPRLSLCRGWVAEETIGKVLIVPGREAFLY